MPAEAEPALTTSLREHGLTALLATFWLGVLCCGIYPALVWVLAQGLFPWRANGSLLTREGLPTTDPGLAVGSELLGQNARAPSYFHPRPSAAGAGHDASSSGGSNLGPLSDHFLNGAVEPGAAAPVPAHEGVRLRVLRYARENGISFRTSVPLETFLRPDGGLDEGRILAAFPRQGDLPGKEALVVQGLSVPGDAVTASGSGLDPHLSPANAALQAPRVARARGLSTEEVLALVVEATEGPDLGLLGEPGVNVLRLNLSLDSRVPAPRAR